MAVCVALRLRAIEAPLQSVERESEQSGSGETDYLVRPAGKQVDVAEIVMSNLVRDDKCDLIVRSATFVKAT